MNQSKLIITIEFVLLTIMSTAVIIWRNKYDEMKQVKDIYYEQSKLVCGPEINLNGSCLNGLKRLELYENGCMKLVECNE